MTWDAAAAASANEPAPIEAAPIEATPIEISVLRGNPTEDELAALIAVVSEAYDAEVVSAVADDTPPASAWARAQREMRHLLSHGPGAWERYGR